MKSEVGERKKREKGNEKRGGRGAKSEVKERKREVGEGKIREGGEMKSEVGERKKRGKGNENRGGKGQKAREGK
jgi:hypothetical protein